MAVKYFGIVCLLLGAVNSQLNAPDATCFKKIATPPAQCCKIPKLTDTTIFDKCLVQNPVIPPIPGTKRTEGCVRKVKISVYGLKN